MEKYILSFDQGTTSSRAIVFDHEGTIKSSAQKEFEQIFPKPGWVEHDPNEIWSSQASVAAEAITKIGINGLNIAAIGITNQRETTIVWDRETGEPVYNAIVWQDRRTASYCDSLKEKNHADMIRSKTGLILDAYFSGTKVKWILDNVEGAREKAEAGKLAFGTVDSWLIWKLTRGEKHVTDVTNASRTLLYNIKDCCWDKELLELFGIPESVLPEVKASSEIVGHTKTTIFAHEIPIAGIAGDQQAALFGQGCFEPGSSKNTYGTGCFLLKNTGDQPIESKNKLLTTVAWKVGNEVNYALEGSVFIGGALVQWLRDGLGIIDHSSDIQKLASQVPDTGGVYLVPAFAGLGAPHWDPHARGMIIGLTRGTGKAHIARAAQEAICFQSLELLQAMEKDSGQPMEMLKVDGGASADDLLLQIQADLLQIPVERPKLVETTAFGAAALAGLAVGFWDNLDDISKVRKVDRIFEPQISKDEAESRFAQWLKAVERCKGWES